MKCRLLTILLIYIVYSFLQTGVLTDYNSTEIASEDAQLHRTENVDHELYKIENASYKNADIEINYPNIVGLADIKAQDEINKIVKSVAFRELNAFSNKSSFDDIGLSLEYNILYQNNDYLSVSFTGYIYIQGTPYPRNLFSTVNIDIANGRRLQFSDMIDINQAFIDKIRERLNLYIDTTRHNSVPYANTLQFYDFDIVYRLVLDDNSDDDFTSMFEQADSVDGNYCYTYFTKDVFGISFEIIHNAGDHFEIEFELEDIEDYLLLKIH